MVLLSENLQAKICSSEANRRLHCRFFCKEKMLAVEIDGSQHYEARNMAEDMERTTKLKGYGVSIIRFGNQDINQQFEAVCAAIDRYVPEKQLWI